MFDLQLFDEEVAENSAETQPAENSQTELPEGFEGLEEFKDEILQELSENQPVEEVTPEVTEEKNSEEIPQYQSKDEEIAALKAQIDELKKNGEKSQPKEESPKQSPMGEMFKSNAQTQMTQRPSVFSQMQVTPEFMSAFNKATDAVAMKMTGFTQKDVEDLQFAEEGDENLARWKFAKQRAARVVENDIQSAQMKMQQEQALRTAAVNSYNEFVAREKAEPDFPNIVVYAANNLFSSLPQTTQQTLANAFAKVEQNTASPAEIMLVQNYFTQAKESYRNQKAQPKNNQSARKAASKLPKADQLNGANANNYGGYSAKDLENIIDSTTDFDKLDLKIKKMFEG